MRRVHHNKNDIHRRLRAGSAFIETMVAMVIVGVAITALMEFMGGSTRSHGSMQRLLQASDYAAAALEYAGNQPFTTLRTFEATPAQYSPPKNAQGVDFANATGWSQVISAKTVSENSLCTNATAGTTPALWVTVTISRNGAAVHSESRLFMPEYQ